MVVVVVKAHLAQRHDLGMPGELANPLRDGVREIAGLVRVNSHRGVDPIVGLGDGQGRIQAVDTSAPARDQDVAKPGGPRAFDYRVAVRVEIGVVNVGVGVDERCQLSVVSCPLLSAHRFG